MYSSLRWSDNLYAKVMMQSSEVQMCQRFGKDVSDVIFRFNSKNRAFASEY